MEEKRCWPFARVVTVHQSSKSIETSKGDSIVLELVEGVDGRMIELGGPISDVYVEEKGDPLSVLSDLLLAPLRGAETPIPSG
jgi:hypothetical protein